MFANAKVVIFVVLSLVLFSTMNTLAAGSGDGIWRQIDDSALIRRPMVRAVTPANYGTFELDKRQLLDLLSRAPEEFSGYSDVMILELPMPDGTLSRFSIEHSLVVERELLVKYPELGQTYRGQGIDDPTATVRFDFLPTGFHAMIRSSNGTTIINPYAMGDTDNYVSFRKNELPKLSEFRCLVGDGGQDSKDFDSISDVLSFDSKDYAPEVAPEVISGTQLRTYKLALAATNEYCVAVGSNTVAGSLAAQVLIMNRVNGVYERDFAIHMNIVGNNNLIVYAGDNTSCGGACTAANDPYSNSSPSSLLTQNQSTLDTVIGTANYDVGHVFSTGGGGLASLNGPCNAANKARAETGLPNPVGDDFAIDFVAHEMGHQFGGNHTFNTSCSGNREPSAAYEPGSGITIMAYAGVCGAQDLAAHSIDTFHVRSLEEIIAYSQTGGGNACPVTTSTGNTPPTTPVVGGPYNIPKQTPFVLTASSTDANGDSITYDWQEYDLGAATSAIPNSDAGGPLPIFRPYLPTVGGSRTFPSAQYIRDNANVPPATYGGGFLTGELLPSITRTMNFQVIARDNRANGGGVNTSTAVVNVDGVSGPFAVTSPNTATTWNAGPQTVTWAVAGTSGAPVSAANVKISLSTDGGLTFPTVLAASTPNDGSETVTSPAVNNSTARIKVEAVGNIFFDMSDVNFTLSSTAAASGSIGGRITRASGRGIGRVYVTITGGSPAVNITAITNSFGYFFFKDINFGSSYTITPLPNNGMTFTPPSIVHNHTAEALNIDFTGQ